jgi:hypothetical protein
MANPQKALVGDKPDGEKTLVMESEEAKDIAVWVSHHRGLYYPADQAVSDEPITEAIRS